jgi:hypothetical protein
VTATGRCIYCMDMTTETTRRRRTTMVPVTTMEEIPVLDENERAELIRSLKEAEADIQAGRSMEYDPKTFKDWLIRIYRRAKR